QRPPGTSLSPYTTLFRSDRHADTRIASPGSLLPTMKDAARTRSISAAAAGGSSSSDQTLAHETSVPGLEPGTVLGGRYEILHLRSQEHTSELESPDHLVS